MLENNHIKTLKEISDQWRSEFSKWVEYPEPDQKFNLKARRPDEKKMFKYLCQMCSLHSRHFNRANEIKALYLVDGYLVMAEKLNTYGIYMFSRSMLELNAFLYTIRSRLDEIKAKPENKCVQTREEFFALIVRARFGTSNPKYQKMFIDNKFPKKGLKPFNIMQSISLLKKSKDFGFLASEYDGLCDYVHHNLSSHTVANQGIFLSDVARTQSGSEIRTPKEGPVTRYQYPADNKAETAIEKTDKFMVDNCEASVKYLSNFPETPFAQDQIANMTGLIAGMPLFPKGFDN